MTSKRPIISEEDRALFLEAIGGATPLPGRARDRVPVLRVPTSVVRVGVVRVGALPAEVKLTVEGDGQRYTARAPGVSRAQLADLRAGKLHVEQTLDLHGDKVEPGIARLRSFLVEASRSGLRCVLVVHGKGTHSEHGAPLREAVLAELLGALSGLVHALSTAAPADGAEGATYVMLRGGR